MTAQVSCQAWDTRIFLLYFNYLCCRQRAQRTIGGRQLPDISSAATADAGAQPCVLADSAPCQSGRRSDRRRTTQQNHMIEYRPPIGRIRYRHPPPRPSALAFRGLESPCEAGERSARSRMTGLPVVFDPADRDRISRLSPGARTAVASAGGRPARGGPSTRAGCRRSSSRRWRPSFPMRSHAPRPR